MTTATIEQAPVEQPSVEPISPSEELNNILERDPTSGSINEVFKNLRQDLVEYSKKNNFETEHKNRLTYGVMVQYSIKAIKNGADQEEVVDGLFNNTKNEIRYISRKDLEAEGQDIKDKKLVNERIEESKDKTVVAIAARINESSSKTEVLSKISLTLKQTREAYLHKMRMQRAVNNAAPGSAERTTAEEALSLAKGTLKGKSLKAFIGTSLTGLALETVSRGIELHDGIGHGTVNTIGRFATASVIGGLWVKGAKRIEKIRESDEVYDAKFVAIKDKIQSFISDKTSEEYKLLLKEKALYANYKIRDNFSGKYAELGVYSDNVKSSVLSAVGNLFNKASSYGKETVVEKKLFYEDMPGAEVTNLNQLYQNKEDISAKLVSEHKAEYEIYQDSEYIAADKEYQKSRDINLENYGRAVETTKLNKKGKAARVIAPLAVIAAGAVIAYKSGVFSEGHSAGTKQRQSGGVKGQNNWLEDSLKDIKPKNKGGNNPKVGTREWLDGLNPQQHKKIEQLSKGIEKIKEMHPETRTDSAKLNTWVENTLRLAAKKDKFLGGSNGQTRIDRGRLFDEQFRQYIESTK